MSALRHYMFIGLAAAAMSPAAAQDEAADAAAVQEEASEDGAVAAATEELFDREPVDCLSLNRIRRTEVIDDATIVFYSRSDETYVNNLPRRCPGLRSNDRFSYELRQSRLCETDWITVLERVGGGFGPGFTCRLGVFHPATEEIVDILKRASETGVGAPTSTVTSVELPEDAGEDAGGEGHAGAAPEGESPAGESPAGEN